MLKQFPRHGRPAPSSRVRRGLTTIELALVAPVFFAIVFGIVEIGRGFMAIHLLNNAARNGCRTGIVEGTSNSNIQAVVNNTLSAQGITAQSITVKVNGSIANASTANAGDELTVVVFLSASKATWLPLPLFLTGTLSGEYALRRE